MNRRACILKAILVLAVVWSVVAGVRALAANRQPTAERVARAIEEARFDDWGGQETGIDPVEVARREKELRKIADWYNRLDFRERERGRESRVSEELYPRLSRAEKRLFLDLTLGDSMKRMLEALDTLPAKERRKFLKEGLEQIAGDGNGPGMQRAMALGDEMLAKVAREGLSAYFDKASIDTKLDLAPLLEAMNEVMQGLRGREFGYPH